MTTTATRQKLARLEAMTKTLPPGPALDTVQLSIATLKKQLTSEKQASQAKAAVEPESEQPQPKAAKVVSGQNEPSPNEGKTAKSKSAKNTALQKEIDRVSEHGHIYQAMAELTGIIRQTGDDYSLELTSPKGQTLGIKPVSRRLPANILAKYVGQTVAVRGYPTLKQLGVVKGIQCIWIGEIKPDSIANRVAIAGVVGPDQRQVWVFRNANAPSADQFNKAWRYDIEWAGVETPRSGNWVRLVGRLGAGSIVVEALVAQSWARPMYAQPKGFKPWWKKCRSTLPPKVVQD